MTFEALETSLAGGRPVRLYEFRRGVLAWRYTSADRDIEFQLQTYESTAISDDGIRQTGEAVADTLTVIAPWNLPVARLFRGAPPSAEIRLTVRDLHYGDGQARVKWIGSVKGAKWPTPERSRLLCQTMTASFERPGLRIGWERGCPYSLYDRNCKVVPGPFGVTATVAVLTGATISASAWGAPADGYFAGGYVEWPIGGGEMEQRGIVSHVGGALGLLGGTDGISVGQSVTAYPGCPRTIAICNSRFGNQDNYGGFPHLPGKNLFDGNPIV